KGVREEGGDREPVRQTTHQGGLAKGEQQPAPERHGPQPLQQLAHHRQPQRSYQGPARHPPHLNPCRHDRLVVDAPASASGASRLAPPPPLILLTRSTGCNPWTVPLAFFRAGAKRLLARADGKAGSGGAVCARQGSVATVSHRESLLTLSAGQ